MRLETIHKTVCRYYKIDNDTLFRRIRNPYVVNARQIFFYLSRYYTNMTLEQIGNHGTLHQFHHATVLHASKLIDGILINDKNTKKDVGNLKNLLESRDVSNGVELLMFKNDLIMSILEAPTMYCLIDSMKTKLKNLN